MVEAITFQTIFQFLQAISIMVGIAYYLLILRNAEKSRRTQQSLQLINRVQDTKFWDNFTHVAYVQEFKTYEEWRDNYGPSSNPKASSAMFSTAQVFVSAGILLELGIVDPDTLYKYVPNIAVVVTWRRIKPWVISTRERYKNPSWMESFEYLYNDVTKRFPDLIIPDDYQNQNR